jgi:sortase B
MHAPQISEKTYTDGHAVSAKKRKRKLLPFLLLLLPLLSVAVPAFALISDSLSDMRNTRDTQTLRALLDIPAQEDMPQTGVPDVPELPLLNFTPLQTANPDIAAWLTLDDTDIDYPVVQGKDNSYYLTRTAEKKNSKNGAIFLDYRANPDFSDFSSVLYGHHMKSGKMFAGLVKFKDKAFFDSHTTGTLYTPGKTYRLEIFAAAVTKPDSDYYNYAFVSPSERESHLRMIGETAKLYRDIGATEQDKILTLSTCSYEYKDARTVVLAKITG